MHDSADKEQSVKLNTACLRHKAESLMRMAAGIAHDYTNFLAAIQGNNELLKIGIEDDAPLMKRVNQIATLTGSALSLTGRMQIFAGHHDVRIEAFEAGSFLSAVAGRMQAHVHSGHTVTINEPAADLIITADREMLDLSLGCLIENASDANVDQKTEIRICCRPLSISDSDTFFDFHGRAFTHGEYLILEVSDTGKGMSDTVLHRAFDPFFSTKIRGEGMGLPTALGVAWAHEGGIQVETSAETGTTVRIIIPA